MCLDPISRRRLLQLSAAGAMISLARAHRFLPRMMRANPSARLGI